MISKKGGGGTGRKIPKKHAFYQSAQISLCINLEPWNFLCSLLLTLSSGKKSQIWISRSYDLQYLGVKIEVRKFETLTFPDRFSCLMAQNDPNRMYMSNSWLDFRIWGHPWCGGRSRGRNCNFSNFVVYDITLWPDLFVLNLKMLKIQNIGGLLYSHFRIRGYRTDLGNGGRFRGWQCNFGIYEPIGSF